VRFGVERLLTRPLGTEQQGCRIGTIKIGHIVGYIKQFTLAGYHFGLLSNCDPSVCIVMDRMATIFLLLLQMSEFSPENLVRRKLSSIYLISPYI
jgi:hypothetical protein